MERIPVIDEVFKQLKCTNEGLASQEGANRLRTYGPNKLEEKKEGEILKFFGFMWNPLSWVMEFAAFTAIALANGGGKPLNWPEFVGIICMLIINSTISFVEENKAGNAATIVMASLAQKTKVLRDGEWRVEEATILVPGDIISIKLGDIVPADARLLEGDPIKIDQSALTGESLPVTKNPRDIVFLGSICKQGQIEAVVVATGAHTFFGKATYLVDDSNYQVGHFQKVLTAIGNFCICFIAVGMLVEIIVMYPIQGRKYRDGIDNLLVLLIGGIPIAMPTVLSVTMAIGSYKLSQQGAIVKRMIFIGEMAGMDVLCSDKNGTLTLNILSVDRNLIEVFTMGVEKEDVVLLAARASRTKTQDAADSAIVRMLTDPEEARAGITEVHFLPFNPVDKRTALTYIDSDGSWHRASKGAPEQILALCNVRGDEKKKVDAIIKLFADRGLRSLAVARQEVPEKTKESSGGPWQFYGLLPLFDPIRHDSAETIQGILNLGVNVKMITGDQLAIAKEIGRRLGMGTNMCPFASLLGEDIDENIAALPVEGLIEKVDGFAGLFPEHKYEIVKKLQERKHICGMIGNGVNDLPALKKANIGIATPDATDAARSASDVVLTEPGLSVIINAISTSRDIFQKMKNYIIYAVSVTISIVFCFMFIALIWKFDFSPFMALIIAILNNGTVITITKDRVKSSPLPDRWKLKEIFTTGVVFGSYSTLMTVIFFWAVKETTFFSRILGVRTINHSPYEIMAALFLQISIMSQALIFATRSRSWSFEHPGLRLVTAFIISQLIATLIAVYAYYLGFARIKGVGWGWAMAIWLYNIIFYVPLDLMKFAIHYILSGKARLNMLENKKIYMDQRSKLEQVAKLDSADTEFLTYKMDKFLNDMSREKPIRFTSQHLMLATYNYSYKLGSGGFGSVYKGVFTDGTTVAVKVLNQTSNERIEQQFMAEVGTTGRVHHLNLVRLIGFCIEKNMRALVYEYMINGSLDKYLFYEKGTLEFEKLHEIAVGTARGIAYLHEECQQRIIHYDIKPQNILLDHNFCPKVADFGLAKLCNREKSHITMTGLRGTPGYAAPELWMPFPVTHKCDVYSFGMLLFEIIGRRKNLDTNITESQEWFPRWVWIKFDSKKLDELTTDCGIADKDKGIVERIAKVALSCVQYRPELRPTMSDVAKMLEGLMDIPYPLNPFQHMIDQGQPIDTQRSDTFIDFSSSLEATKSAIDHSRPITRMHEIEIDMS